jgi:hypothetical protein
MGAIGINGLVTWQTGQGEVGHGMDKVMLSVSAARLFGSVGLVISLCVVAVGSSMPGSAQSTPLEVTSDTPEYCLRLLARLNDLVHVSPAPPPPEVIRLTTDGQRMCDQGQTRGGILRLRRAWLLLAHPESASAHPPDGTAAR